MNLNTDKSTIVLSVLSLLLFGITIWFIVDSETALTNCVNNVPPKHCNRAAGDFAVESDTSSKDILGGCGSTGNRKCIFTNIPNTSEAIKKCISLGNKCNRFIYEKNTMYLVSLVGKTSFSKGKHMFVRQNGITYKGRGKTGRSYPNRDLQGENIGVTNFNYNTRSMTSSGTAGSYSTSTTSSGSYSTSTTSSGSGY
mgnify:FL=1